MKRTIILGVALFAFGAFVVAPGTAMAGKNCGSAKTADAKQVSSKTCSSAKTADVNTADAKLVSSKACGSAKTGDAKLASAHAGCNIGAKACTDEEMAACAAKMGVSVEECKKMWATGNMSVVNISIQGMTCGGCENSISAALESVPGVVKVQSVSHKDGTARLCITKEADQSALIKAVTNKGYQAEFIQAVVTVSDDASVKTASSAGCNKQASGKAGCCAKGASAKSADATAASSSAGGTK